MVALCQEAQEPASVCAVPSFRGQDGGGQQFAIERSAKPFCPDDVIATVLLERCSHAFCMRKAPA
ncbi:hypothetical protein A8V01_20330 [Novosphingobium guangzhouense]|uniref:Uncharacterized protein n=1 Tax=Novosphingobium guangzhouense TaxID=1850347 RepID=A0A2K2G092_9SPHN|nr:hypothetical protein A8V01_20330 [Novosphingobium guangzhouense]